MQGRARGIRAHVSLGAVALTLLFITPLACRADQSSDRVSIVADIKARRTHYRQAAE